MRKIIGDTYEPHPLFVLQQSMPWGVECDNVASSTDFHYTDR